MKGHVHAQDGVEPVAHRGGAAVSDIDLDVLPRTHALPRDLNASGRLLEAVYLVKETAQQREIRAYAASEVGDVRGPARGRGQLVPDDRAARAEQCVEHLLSPPVRDPVPVLGIDGARPTSFERHKRRRITTISPASSEPSLGGVPSFSCLLFASPPWAP